MASPACPSYDVSAIRRQRLLRSLRRLGLGAQSLDSVGTFTANAIYNPENVNRLETAFREELDRVLKDGFTAEEVEKAKQVHTEGEQIKA